MSAECNTSGAVTLPLFLEFKGVNNFQKITKYFNDHINIPLHLSNRLTFDQHRIRGD